MGLTIERATEGVNANEVQTALNAIHASVILDAQNQMRTELNTLTQGVDDVWVGQSAEAFKHNMEVVMNEIIDALDSSYRDVESMFNQVTNNFLEFDENLIQRKG